MNAQVKKLLRGKKACDPASHMWMKKNNGTMAKGAVKLGQGRYGKVYRGCIDDGCEKYIAYKEIKSPSLNDNLPLAGFKRALNEINPKMEFTIAKKLEGFGVPKMYFYKSCDDNDIIYSEYVNGKELGEWIWNKPTLGAIKSVMVQVIYNLYRIQKKYPGFRHHDLHSGNILVRPVPTKDMKIMGRSISNAGFEAVIIDFGFAVFPRIKNPLVNANNYKKIGISRKSDKHYDLHTFLNSIYNTVRQDRTPAERMVKTFIEKLLPPNYLVDKSNAVKNYRLRGNKSVNLSLEEVLSKPFFTGETRIKKVIPRTTKPKSIIKIQAPKPKSPVNKEAAKARAVAILKMGRAKPKKRPGIVRVRP